MTHVERQTLIGKPFPPFRRIVYTGAPWAGVLVPRTDDYEELMRTLKRQLSQRGEHGMFEYHGLYRDAGSISLQDAIEVFGEANCVE